MLLHKRWVHKSFRPISNRVCVLDLALGSWAISIIGVYMPRGGQTEEDVEAVYAALDAEISRTRHAGGKCVIAGDFNAEAGAWEEGDSPYISADNSLKRRNSRGRMLVSWATVQDLVLANTFTDKERESIWIFQNGRRRARLDYLLLDRCLHNAGKCEVMTDIDIGSDHRPLCHVLSCRRARHAHGKQGRQSKRNYDGSIFKAKCEAMLGQYPAQASSTNRIISKKCCLNLPVQRQAGEKPHRE